MWVNFLNAIEMTSAIHIKLKRWAKFWQSYSRRQINAQEAMNFSIPPMYQVQVIRRMTKLHALWLLIKAITIPLRIMSRQWKEWLSEKFSVFVYRSIDKQSKSDKNMSKSTIGRHRNIHRADSNSIFQTPLNRMDFFHYDEKKMKKKKINWRSRNDTINRLAVFVPTFWNFKNQHWRMVFFTQFFAQFA